MKSVINGVTTYFVGNHYEVTGTQVTKYYFAGNQRIAMRKGGILTYMLADHLGSTSLITNTSGNVISETRYTAWGEVRYQSGSEGTKYQFTGQYSDSYINLLWYNSRHYDPELGRFIQPDSIVPLAAQGTQAYDRYANVNNNPARYNDPSGHCIFDPVEFVACIAVGLLVADVVGTVMFGTSPDALGLGHAEQYVTNSGDIASTYIAAGIAVQSNYYPLGDIFYRNRDTSGFGYAQASKEEAGKYGDPSDPNVSIAVMQQRISSVTNMCKDKCSQTDIFIAAALAQNGPGFTKSNMASLLNGKYGTPNTSDPTKAFLPWDKFLGSLDDSSYYRLMLRMFKNDVQAIGNNGWKVPDNIDWDYIDDLSQGGWRSAW